MHMPAISIFPWDDNFNTGLPLVDEQHRKLVDLLNVLAAHIVFHSDLPELSGVLADLAEYTVYHFETEERIWEEFFIGDVLELGHKQNHQSFVQTIRDLSDLESRHSPDVLERILAFLTRWLASHILERDRHAAMVVAALKDGLDMDAAKARAEKEMSGSTRVLIDIILSVYSTLSSNAIELMREVAARKKANQELLRFTDVLAHHLQEPVRAQLLYTSFLKDSFPATAENSEVTKALDNVRNGAERLRSLLRDMQLYLSIASSPQRSKDCDATQAAHRALARLAHKVSVVGASVDIADMPAVRVIDGRLSDVFFALLDNALTYGGDGGPVRVVMTAQPQKTGGVVISVDDNGTPIDQGFRERVFKVFERLDPGTAAEGTGIGLAVARKIVDMSGGRIWIEESGLGGTRVSFFLPEAAGGA